MKLIGLEAIYQKPNHSSKHPNNPIYSYLLGNLKINRSNEVWVSEIIYVLIQGGCIYLCAIIDWSTRAVLVWQLSTTTDASFCIYVLIVALAKNTENEKSLIQTNEANIVHQNLRNINHKRH